MSGSLAVITSVEPTSGVRIREAISQPGKGTQANDQGTEPLAHPRDKLEQMECEMKEWRGRPEELRPSIKRVRCVNSEPMPSRAD